MMAWHDPRRLTGMAAPLAIWALHFLLVYGLQGLACAEGIFRSTLAGQTQVFWLWLLLTALALATVTWLGMRAWKAHRSAPREAAGGDRRRETAFATRLTLGVAAMAFVAVVFTVVPVFVLPVCS